MAGLERETLVPAPHSPHKIEKIKLDARNLETTHKALTCWFLHDCRLPIESSTKSLTATRHCECQAPSFAIMRDLARSAASELLGNAGTAGQAWNVTVTETGSSTHPGFWQENDGSESGLSLSWTDYFSAATPSAQADLTG